ncbi:TPA: hypothetical protein N0F65_005871 [Lagenidium giganteum]|uniref:Serine protease n=1 Tax=Lagenidium giganteum TaxID=4803 RepID=A0AAV2YKN7_9STRA|nr:TPA: hypothetical protein N0F65_005871 [Lagenidium giganteum]
MVSSVRSRCRGAQALCVLLLIFVAASTTQGDEDQVETAVQVAAVSQESGLLLGVGCGLADYDKLPTVSSDGDLASWTPSYRVLQDSGAGSGVLTLHFSRFQLPPEDFVLLRSSSVDRLSSSVQVLYGHNNTGAFYAFPIQGSGFVVEFFKKARPSSTAPASSASCVGFEIDGVRFTPKEDSETLLEGLPTPTPGTLVALTAPANASRERTQSESICGEDESQEAVCAATKAGTNGAAMVAHSAAVARLVIRKNNNLNIAYCTGFLLGCEGHVLTNQHCIGNWLDALNTAVEFHAEAATCGPTESCESRAACPGRTQISSTQLVAVSKDLDYALVRLVPAYSSQALLTQVGGYLQLRASGPRLGEEVYIPQYPLGWGKRIAWTADGKPGRIESLTTSECGGSDAGYYVDTQEGSSGSPVIAQSDNTVVALHHCGGCLNGGIPSQALIADLQLKGVLPRCATA